MAVHFLKQFSRCDAHMISNIPMFRKTYRTNKLQFPPLFLSIIEMICMGYFMLFCLHLWIYLIFYYLYSTKIKLIWVIYERWLGLTPVKPMVWRSFWNIHFKNSVLTVKSMLILHQFLFSWSLWKPPMIHLKVTRFNHYKERDSNICLKNKNRKLIIWI